MKTSVKLSCASVCASVVFSSLMLASSLFSGGCIALFPPEDITIDSNPSGATYKIYNTSFKYNRERKTYLTETNIVASGVTPDKFRGHLYINEKLYPHVVAFEKLGYMPHQAKLTSEERSGITLDMIMGVPFGIDIIHMLFTGKDCFNEYKNLSVNLTPIPNPSPLQQPAATHVPIIFAPIAETKPASSAKVPVKVKSWNYDKENQKASYVFQIVDDDADAFQVRRWAMNEVREICKEEYLSANPGTNLDNMHFAIVSELNDRAIDITVSIYLIRPISHSYDSAARTGKLVLDLGNKNYFETYRWAIDNIGTICSTKSIVLTDGQPIPSGAQFKIIKETSNDKGFLEIEFQVVN